MKSPDDPIDCLSFPVLATATAATVLMGILAVLAPPAVQTGGVGMLAGVAVGLLVQLSSRIRQHATQHQRLLNLLRAPVALVDHPELLNLHMDLSRSLIALARRTDTVLRELALLKLFSVAEDVRAIASGRVIFTATESWRKVYEQILRSKDLKRYRSVAWIRTEDYWRDVPGERSMQLNFELLAAGVTIERILVVCDFLWPPAATLPAKDIQQWIDRQHQQGVKLHLVRESELLSEKDLLTDFGIYGERATGIQELDNQARTNRFILNFDRQSIELASDRWNRLAVYTVSYQDLLAQANAQRKA